MLVSQKHVFKKEEACTFLIMRKYITSQVSILWYNVYELHFV